MWTTIAIILLFVVMPLFLTFIFVQLASKTPESRPVVVKATPKKTDWYGHGPWQAVSDGEHICIQQGLQDPTRVWIVRSMYGGGGIVTTHDPTHDRSGWSGYSWTTEARADDLPVVRQHCARENEKLVVVAEERARHDAWLEMNQTVL